MNETSNFPSNRLDTCSEFENDEDDSPRLPIDIEDINFETPPKNKMNLKYELRATDNPKVIKRLDFSA